MNQYVNRVKLGHKSHQFVITIIIHIECGNNMIVKVTVRL